MTRTIMYNNKHTSAKTVYREIEHKEQDWILTQLVHWTTEMGTLSNARDQDSRQIRDGFWREITKELPRGQNGPNSPESMVAGILDNMLYSATPQRDFSDKQCDAIERISECMHTYNNTFPKIKFKSRTI